MEVYKVTMKSGRVRTEFADTASAAMRYAEAQSPVFMDEAINAEKVS